MIMISHLAGPAPGTRRVQVFDNPQATHLLIVRVRALIEVGAPFRGGSSFGGSGFLALPIACLLRNYVIPGSPDCPALRVAGTTPKARPGIVPDLGDPLTHGC